MDITIAIAIAATTGYVVASVALVREMRRQVAAEWTRLRQARDVTDYKQGVVEADDLRAQVLSYGNLLPESGRTEGKFWPLSEKCVDPNCPDAMTDHTIGDHPATEDT